VLLLVPGETYRAADFMEAASRLRAELGVELVVGSDAESALGALLPGRFLRLDFGDAERAARQIAAFVDAEPGRDLDRVVAVDDGGTLIAAHVAERLDLEGNAVDAVAATRDKSQLRERLAAAGLPSPRWWLLREDEEPAALAPRLDYPCVVKPLSLSGSRGVIRADNPAAFVAAAERTRRLLRRPEVARECRLAGADLLIEGYVPGREVAIEGLLEPGTDGAPHLRVLAIFDKPDPLEGPYFEETIYGTPSRLPEVEQRRAVETAERAALALGLQQGPLHAELRLNEDGAWPIDLAARSIGGLCARALRFGPRDEGGDGTDGAPEGGAHVERSAPVSLEELLLRDALGGGDATAGYGRERAASGVMMIPIPAAGVLRAVSGVAEAEALPGIDGVSITVAPGRRLVLLPEGGEYLGFLFARGEMPATVEAALRTAHAALRFDIEAAPPERG
jgi:hypothetical protein